MTKKRLIAILAFGILAALFLTACAGVAAGQISDAPGAGEVPVVGGFLFDVQAIPIPFLDTARPAQSAEFLFEKAPVQRLAESQSLMQYHMLCNRAGH